MNRRSAQARLGCKTGFVKRLHSSLVLAVGALVATASIIHSDRIPNSANTSAKIADTRTATDRSAPLVSASSTAVPTMGERIAASMAGRRRAPLKPLGDPGNWRLKFHDEFNGRSLNRSVWSYGFYPGSFAPANNNETENYGARQVTESHGTLNLTAIAKKSTVRSGDFTSTEPNLSGAVNTWHSERFVYGFFQARIYNPGNASSQILNWPAFWMYGVDLNWPVSGEIDIFEGLNGLAGWHFAYGASASSPIYAGANQQGNYAGWHVYGADWEPGSVTFYYDGHQVGSITQGVTSKPMFIIFNLATGGNGGPTHVPSTMRIDYMRVWQH